jgi:hypothetical protein
MRDSLAKRKPDRESLLSGLHLFNACLAAFFDLT